MGGDPINGIDPDGRFIVGLLATGEPHKALVNKSITQIEYGFDLSIVFAEMALSNAVARIGYVSDVRSTIMEYTSPVSFRPQFQVGSDGFFVGGEVSYGIPKLMGYSYRKHNGAGYMKNNDGLGSGMVTWEGESSTIGYVINSRGTTYSTPYGEQTQHTWTIGNPLAKGSLTNDAETGGSLPFVRGGNGDDKHRTASAGLRFGLFEAGFELITGESTNTVDDDGYWIEKEGDNAPRAGKLYLGFGNMKIGWNSEAIRRGIQNNLHDLLEIRNFSTRNDPNSFYYNGGINLWY